MLAVAVGADRRLADPRRRRDAVNALAERLGDLGMAGGTGRGNVLAVHLRLRVLGRQNAVAAVAVAAGRRVLAPGDAAGVHARLVGRERLHQLDPRLGSQLGVRMALAAGRREPLRVDLGGFVGGRRHRVQRAVAAQTVGALGARRVGLVVDARRERLLGVAVTVRAGRTRIVGLVRVVGFAGVTVGAARPRRAVHRRRPLRLVDDQTLFADVVRRTVALEALFRGTRRCRRTEGQGEPGEGKQATR